jgi:YegS/Rv2252/BmrU family lipid kinase
MREALLIVNPAAGGTADGALGSEVVGLLAGEGIRAKLHVTAAAGGVRRAAQKAVDEGFGLVLVAGGDGTVGVAVGPLAGTEAVLGIIPVGTANGIALELGLPIADVPAACRLVATGQAFAADVGVCNGHEFLLMCGVGLDAVVAERVDVLWKRALGRWAFVGQFLQTVLQEPMRPFRVTVDGRACEAPMWAAVVCNGAQYSWRLSFAPTARLDDGLLHVVMFHQPDALCLLNAVGTEFLIGGASRLPHTTVTQGRTVRVEADPPAPWQTDGDPGGVTPVEVTIRPKSLRVIGSPDAARS